MIREPLYFGLDPRLRGHLAERAAGRAVVIDWYAERCCTSVTIGDLVVRVGDPPDAEGFVEAVPVEGVRIAVASGLVELFFRARPTLRLGGLPWSPHLAIELERPEEWLDFLFCRPARHHPTRIGA